MTRLAPFILLLLIVLAAWLFSPDPGGCRLSAPLPATDLAARMPDFFSYRAGWPRKQAFVDYLLPLIEAENRRIRDDREKVLCLQSLASLTSAEQQWLDQLAARYRLPPLAYSGKAPWAGLLARVDVIPPSLALAQGANESAWGTSRFAREGNNLFGQWCFQTGCGLVPRRRPEGAVHEVAVFSSPQQSVRDYMRNLNSHPRYRLLRSLRAAGGDGRPFASGAELAKGLSGYSALGERYVRELQELIRHNHWAYYDRLPEGA